jgi:hypothetical protein
MRRSHSSLFYSLTMTIISTPPQSLQDGLAALSSRASKRKYRTTDSASKCRMRFAELAPTMTLTLPPPCNRAFTSLKAEPQETQDDTKEVDEEEKPLEETPPIISINTKTELDETQKTGSSNKNKQLAYQDLIAEDLQRYQELSKQAQDELDSIAEQRQEIYTKQVELWGAYKYGLEKISNLNDLGEAPDAILPGNFC